MVKSGRMLLALVEGPWVSCSGLYAIEANLDRTLTVEKLKPQGDYY